MVLMLGSEYGKNRVETETMIEKKGLGIDGKPVDYDAKDFLSVPKYTLIAADQFFPVESANPQAQPSHSFAANDPASKVSWGLFPHQIAPIDHATQQLTASNTAHVCAVGSSCSS